jgi:hypothetical protein
MEGVKVKEEEHQKGQGEKQVEEKGIARSSKIRYCQDCEEYLPNGYYECAHCGRYLCKECSKVHEINCPEFDNYDEYYELTQINRIVDGR